MDTVLPILRRPSRLDILARVAKPNFAAAAEPRGRRSPGRPSVPRDRIVAAALQIVDEQGAEALSMRTLAQRLDSGTATLYRHFANRSDVVAQVVDRVFGEVEYDADDLSSKPWQELCKSFARATFDVLRRHPNVAPLLVERIPVGPNAMTGRERVIALLLDSGFPPDLAARSYATVARHVLGFAIQVTGHSTAGDLDDAMASDLFHGVDRAEFPATIRVADHMPVPLEEEFEFGLELIINGLTQLQRRDNLRNKGEVRTD
jgi:TetR/AcrR family transcriptional regulator, tetracycline repressor protein